MTVLIEKQGTLEGFKKLVLEATAGDDTGSLLVLACDANGFSPESLDPVLQGISTPVYGGIFPAVLYDKSILHQGTIVVPISRPTTCITLDELSNAASDFVRDIDRQIKEPPDVGTMLIFVDAFARRLDALINALFTVFGLEYNYIGGGAGSLAMEATASVITNQGLKKDAAVIALLETPSRVGVCHGWQSVAGPFRITESEGNVIKSIDWKPAYDFYRDFLTQYGQVQLTRRNFYAFAKGYPFGIAKLEAERVVRGPVRVTPEGHLVCVGDVPEGCFVDILHGDTTSLIRAAKEAGELCRAQGEPDFKKPLGLFMDCVSRMLYLEKDFDRELQAALMENQPTVGACTIGEIANTGNSYIEFYNRTSVIGNLECS